MLTVERIYYFPPRIVDDSVNAETISAESRVNKDIFGFAYLLWATLNYGEVECSDLIALFKIFLMNRQNLPSVESAISWFFTIPQKLTSFRFLNTLRKLKHIIDKAKISSDRHVLEIGSG